MFNNYIFDKLRNQEETCEFKAKLVDLEVKLRETEHEVDQVNRLQANHNINTLTPTMRHSHNKNASSISSLLITPTIRKSVCSSVMSEAMECSSYLDEQTRMREVLARNFEERFHNLERSKQQTRNVIESLKLNLNDIELMTANNIFKITSFS